ncbi:hypothetical protein [Actinoplanes sp. NPDC049802]|uniref:hypothetical protein n=1 Tax=Actinoplanes sp. NPDC049802 TaxID=3154742 RepID=UPI00340281AC
MRGLIVVLAAGVLAAGGCAGAGSESRDSEPGAPGAGAPGGEPQAGLVELRVAVAESLAEDFAPVEQGFEMRHPSIEVLVAAGDGEPADVVVTDDPVPAATGTVEKIGPLRVVVVPGAGAEAAAFAEFLRDGDGRRILLDSGLLRP